MEPVSWGVIGASANIATRRVIAAMQGGRRSRIVALGSRDESKALEVARRYGIARAYGSYDAVIDDPEVEALYNPLPNHLHLPWTLRAARAGKHVLCEKPLGLDAGEVERMIEARDRHGVHIQESFMIRSHPQWLRTRELTRQGRIGTLRAIQGTFCHHLTDPDNIRNKPETGGGGLYDIGCYPITTSRFVLGTEPARAVALVERDPVLKVDRLATAILDFPGVQASFVCSQQAVSIERMTFLGTEGRIELRMPFDAPHESPCRLIIDDGSDRHDASATVETLEVADQYTIQGDLFSESIRSGAPPAVSLEDSLGNMRVIDALYRSAESGGWEAVRQPTERP